MLERGTDLLNRSSMNADGLVKKLAGDVELMRPIENVRRHLGIDVLGVVGRLRDGFVQRGEGVEVGGGDVEIAGRVGHFLI